MNGVATNYCNHALATQQVVDTVATIDAVNRLMAPASTFSVTLTGMSAGAMFSFNMSASGTFTVDWGDGTTVDTIVKTDTTDTTYVHSYASSGTYAVRFAGKATGYNASYEIATISFNDAINKAKMTRISGSLGAIFSTIGTASPRFNQTFYGCSGLTGSIPAGLFAGITGAPVPHMFQSTFTYCTGLTGSIPAGLFAGINGAPAESMFFNTFAYCAGLTGSIPAGLFAGISGQPRRSMFQNTFGSCTGLTGTVPSGLFGKFTGYDADGMFYATFTKCTNLTGIADGIWDISEITHLTDLALFLGLFSSCNKITTASPNIAPGSSVRLYQKFADYVPNSAMKPFTGCTSMADYASIPAAWK
jgi:hypothetical protein